MSGARERTGVIESFGFGAAIGLFGYCAGLLVASWTGPPSRAENCADRWSLIQPDTARMVSTYPDCEPSDWRAG